MNNLDLIKEVTASGTSTFHREQLDAQYAHNLEQSKKTGCPVFNVFYITEPTTKEDGTVSFSVESQWFTVRDELALTRAEARPLIEEFHINQLNQTN